LARGVEAMGAVSVAIHTAVPENRSIKKGVYYSKAKYAKGK
jgi:hypothetical protein